MSAFIEAFRSKRVGISIPLGFAAGLAFSMRGSTLSAWVTDAGLDIKTIAMFAWVGLFFTLKPLWAPFIDRYTIPILGRRRGWMLVTQIALGFAIAGMGLLDPKQAVLGLAALALFTSFLTASHDIATDAYRADLLAPNERASGSAMYVMGYRIAVLLAGAGALVLSDYISWSVVYFVMGALMIVGVFATWFGPEPERVAAPRTIREAVVEPLRDFFSRRGAIAALAFILLYKFGDYMAADINITFLMKIGFSKAEIAGVLKVMGMIATIVGTILGAGLVPMLGVRRALLLFGILQALMNAGYFALAIYGPNHILLVTAITADWFCGGLATAAFSAYQLSLCSKRFSATQYALIASASTLLGRSIAGLNGFIVDGVGWSGFFATTMIVAIPGLLLVLFGRLERAVADQVPAPPKVAA
jgi:MFS transporter, PAT family, beta-lactamase induction signal transducer AmpG